MAASSGVDSVEASSNVRVGPSSGTSRDMRRTSAACEASEAPWFPSTLAHAKLMPTRASRASGASVNGNIWHASGFASSPCSAWIRHLPSA